MVVIRYSCTQNKTFHLNLITIKNSIMDFRKTTQRVFVLLLLSTICSIAFAQSHQLKGTVLDNAGEPIIGANILIVGTTNGVITDLEGNFTLQDVPLNAKCRFLLLGILLKLLQLGNNPISKLL